MLRDSFCFRRDWQYNCYKLKEQNLKLPQLMIEINYNR